MSYFKLYNEYMLCEMIKKIFVAPNLYIYILKKIKIENIKHHNIHIDVNENALN